GGVDGMVGEGADHGSRPARARAEGGGEGGASGSARAAQRVDSAAMTWRVVGLLVLASLFVTPAGATAQSAEKGQAAYVKHGCWQCHGLAAQGGVTGPKLAPDPMPLVALTAFVRHTRGAMPPYQEAIMSNDDLADIHAWLQSLPRPRDYRSIPLLNP